MKKDNIDTLFENLKNDFDIENPNLNHQQRFLDKLKNQNKVADSTITKRSYWKPLLRIAASVVLLVAFSLEHSKK